MGRTQAEGFAEAVADGSVSLDAALEYHLFSNHYPPLPRGTLALAKQAIAACNEGAPGRRIDVSGVGRHRRWGTKVPASEVCESWHLEAFVASEEV